MDFDSSDGIKSAWLKLDHLEEIKAVNKVSVDEEGPILLRQKRKIICNAEAYVCL